MLANTFSDMRVTLFSEFDSYAPKNGVSTQQNIVWHVLTHEMILNIIKLVLVTTVISCQKMTDSLFQIIIICRGN